MHFNLIDLIGGAEIADSAQVDSISPSRLI